MQNVVAPGKIAVGKASLRNVNFLSIDMTESIIGGRRGEREIKGGLEFSVHHR